MQKARDIGRLLLDYAELLLATALVIVLTALDVLGEITSADLTRASILLLAALAIAVIRERAERRAMTERIENKLTLAVADKPWQVLDEKLMWDLSQSNGYAKAIAEKELQFMQDEVFSVYEFQFSPPGKLLSHVCEGGERGVPMEELRIVPDGFHGPDGRIYRLISLERVWHRGEIMAFRSERHLQDYFSKSREDVSKDVTVPTTRVSMRVKWPADRKPTAVWLERSGRGRSHIKLRRRRRSGDPWSHTEVITDPKVGERIMLRWTW
jgi:hypothetical protein